jgi:hypothetical protein
MVQKKASMKMKCPHCKKWIYFSWTSPTLRPDKRSVVGKLERVLDTIAEIEDKDGITEGSELYEILQDEEGIDMKQARKLIRELIRDNVFSCPEAGLIKRTASS